MKTLKVIWVLILGFVVAACNDDEMASTNKISSEEQAEIVAAAIGRSGFAGAGRQSAEQAENSTDASGKIIECGYTDDGNVNLSGVLGSISFSYLFEYNVELNCNSSEEPQSFSSEFTYEGSYSSPRFESDYSGNGSLVVTQLGEEFESFEIDGSYNREGSFETKVGKQSSGSSDIEIDINDVLIRKSDKVIIDGSADLSISGQVSGKGIYSFDALVEFNDNGTATITVSGDTYIMNVATGEVTVQGQS